jgi:uncharacterized linocin/CFP29 family protein
MIPVTIKSYKGKKIVFTNIHDGEVMANQGGEFGMVTIGKDVDDAFESMKKMIDEHSR